MTELPKSRAEAKISGALYYRTSKPCKKGHFADRQTSNGNCIECNRGYAMRHYFDNFSSRILKVKKYQSENPDKVLKWTKQTYLNNKRAYCDRASKRHILKKTHTPKWLSESDRIELINIYKERDRLILITGIEFHVDHVVPLNNKDVCGLHVPWNLQILTARENISKSNKFSSGGA